MTLAPVYDLRQRRDTVTALVEDNRAWALTIARGIMQGRTDWRWRADAESAALYGLWQAARRWNGTGDFRAWAAMRVRGAVADALRQLTRRSRQRVTCECKGTDLDCRICNGTGHPFPVPNESLDILETQDHMPVLASPEPDEDCSADIRQLALVTLTGQQLQVVLLILDGDRYRTIASALGVSESRISQIMKAAAARLRLAAKRAGLVEAAA